MAKSKKSQREIKLVQKSYLPILLPTLLLLLTVLSFQLIFLNRIYPGIYLANVNLSHLTVSEAAQKVDNEIAKRAGEILEFTFEDQKFTIDLKGTVETVDQAALKEVLEYGRLKFFIPNLKLVPILKLNSRLDDQLKLIANEINQPPIEAQLKIEGETVGVSPSQQGLVLDQEKLKLEIINYLSTGQKPQVKLAAKPIPPHLTYEAALEIKKALDNVKKTPIKLTFSDQTYFLGFAKLVSMIDAKSSQSKLIRANLSGHQLEIGSIKVGDVTFSDIELSLDQEKLQTFLKNIALEIDRPVKEPLFSYSGNKVTQFQPPQEGLRLDQAASAQKIIQEVVNLSKGRATQSSVELTVEMTKPKNKLTNELGINQLIGRGVSYFAGSIANRVFNINLAASRINGILIAPQAAFSFNDTVGDISAASGYKQAYVIKSGRTVLDDGGGVCQVSTTLFRSVLNSGLPVVARVAHAYRVGYYEQDGPPGYDATIFAPSVDFKFKNDTPAHILVQAYTVGNTLYVDFYGTSDGRVAHVTKSIVSNIISAPADLRQDDPNLPKGVVKQVDFAAAGAKVIFSRTVTKAGQTLINESFTSNYRPWQAIFLVGTKQ